MIVNDLTLKIQMIWQERINQKIDSSFILFDQLKVSLDLPIHVSLSEVVGLNELLSDFESSLVCDLLALESSLARAQKRPELSVKALAYVDQISSYEAQIFSFVLQFEKAVSAFSKNDWLRAAEFFQRALGLTKTNVEKTACLVNLIFCLENLEIPFERSLAELTPMLDTLQGSLADGIRPQLECLNLRQAWRRNDFTFLADLELGNQKITQSTYFRAYLAQIPYLQNRAPNFSIENFVKQPGHLFNKDFRLHTLTLQFPEQDIQLGRVTDFIERLYLGVWQWMCSPDQQGLTFLIQSVQHFPWAQLDSVGHLSIEDQSFLFLSLGWLGAFDPRLASFTEKLSAKLRFSESNQTLLAERAALFVITKKNVLAEVNSLTAHILNLIAYQKDRIETQIIAASDLITIDYSNHQVQGKDGQKVRSRALTLALKNLKLNRSVTVENFYASINDHIEFDQFIHQPQVSNLIYKINQLIKPELNVSQKDGLVSLVGDPQILSLIHFDRRHEMLLSLREWQSCIQKFKNQFEVKQESKGFNLKKMFMLVAASGASFNRLDVQRITELSKSECHRVLAQWKSRGWILQKGFGKKTVYKVKTNTEKIA